jgi:hypothetical protein
MTRATLKRREERKRERHWDPALRWKVIQDTITWAEAQAPLPRNSPQRCRAEEARKLGR